MRRKAYLDIKRRRAELRDFWFCFGCGAFLGLSFLGCLASMFI